MKLQPTVALALLALVTSAHAQDEDGKPALADDSQALQPPEAQAGPAGQPTAVAEGDAGPLALIGMNPPHDAAPPAAGRRAAPAKSAGIEEVIVTATKSEASIRDVPISMQAMKGDDLVQQGTTSLDDILKNTPAVNKTSNQVTIRGVGTTSETQIGGGEETGYFLGEATLIAPSVASGVPDLDPYDLSTVEILEGPQSTLFGGTALAGAIRYIPNKPDLDSFYGGARFGYGRLAHADDPLKEVSAMLNLPITDTFALRAAATVRDRPNVVDDTRGDRDNLDSSELSQARILARWEIGDRLSANVIYMHYDASRYLSFLDNPDRYESPYTRLDEDAEDEIDVGSLSLAYAFDAFTVTGVVNTLDTRTYRPADGAPVLGVADVGTVPSRVNGKANVPSYELRMVSNEPTESGWWLFDSWDYVAGLYYMKAEQKASQIVSLQASILPLLGIQFPFPLPDDLEVAFSGSHNDVELSEKALFFNLNRRLLDERLEFNVGARFAKTVMDAYGEQESAGAQRLENRTRESDGRINPKLALTWHFSDDLNVRASMSEGFRFGGANTAYTIGIEDIPPTFKSDSLRNYELGLRSDWFDRTLRFDITGFHIDWMDLQVSQTSPLAANYTDNVGSAVIDGVEASFIWQLPSDWPLIPEGLSLASAWTYLDARTAESFDSANGTFEKGTRLPLSARQSATLGLSWQGQWGNWDLNSSVLASYAGSRTNNLAATYKFDPYTNWNASFRASNPTWPGAPAFMLSGVNLTDEMILVYANPMTANPNQFVFLPQGPRVIKLGVEFFFGKG